MLVTLAQDPKTGKIHLIWREEDDTYKSWDVAACGDCSPIGEGAWIEDDIELPIDSKNLCPDCWLRDAEGRVISKG